MKRVNFWKRFAVFCFLDLLVADAVLATPAQVSLKIKNKQKKKEKERKTGGGGKKEWDKGTST